jgi:hypothetical protein
MAALTLPGPAGSAATIASVLAVGALALLAGHAWGLLIVAIAEVLLLGEVWPMVVFGDGELPPRVVAAVALGSALPGVVLLGRTLPALVDILLEDPPGHIRHMGVATGAVLAGLALVLPAL